ncbi:MAG: PASTA domain-containing protein [Candidatus Sumerlaeota bacterium]|nr:PASTA domain-containing protein [Candidatus Sumerlaeota bacterium]
MWNARIHFGRAAMALAVAAVLLMGTRTARAVDTSEDFSLATANTNMVSPPTPAGTADLLNNADLKYDWGGFAAANPLATGSNIVRINNLSGMQFRNGAAVPGSYFVTRFTSGDSAVVNKLKYIDVTENQTDFQARLLVRNHTDGSWYASSSVSLVDAISFDVNTLQWAPVTNAATAIEAAVGAGAPNFDALTFGSLGAWPTDMNVDGGGLCVDNDNALNGCRIQMMAWKEPIVGGITVPNVTAISKGAAAAALTALGLTSSEVSPKVNNDSYPVDYVTATSPVAGIVVAPGTNVALTICGGADEYWNWVGGADPNVQTQANWAVGGTDLTVPADPYDGSIDSTERLVVRSGSVAWNTGSLVADKILILNGATVTMNSGVTLNVSNTQNSQVGSGYANLGSGAGTLVINTGATVTFRALNIGQTSMFQAGSGSLTINGGTVTLTNTLNIGNPDNGAGAGTALLHLNGSAALMALTTNSNMVLNSPLAVLKFTGDASGFGKITMSATNQDFTLTSGTIQIDATNVPVSGAQSWTLVDCGQNILDNGNILGTAVTVTPRAGTSAADWRVTIADTNPDDLVLTYTPNNPPAFTQDPFSKPSARTGIAYNQSIAGDASDPDVGNTLTFAKVSGPPWLSVAADGALTGIPSDGDLGENTFVVSVTDQGSLSDTATMTILVSNVSAAKTWTEY